MSPYIQEPKLHMKSACKFIEVCPHYIISLQLTLTNQGEVVIPKLCLFVFKMTLRHCFPILSGHYSAENATDHLSLGR